MPSTPDEWVKIADVFEQRWNFPNCVGALDGKHVVIKAPKHAGTEYFNYKKTHSVVLMALADGEYKFTFIDVGASGRCSDGGVFNNSRLAGALAENSLNMPQAKPLPGREKPVPYMVVADDAFALKPYLMKPIPSRQLSMIERVYNYRLSRARRIVENAFGIASARFRVLRKNIELEPNKVEKIILAVCAMHNFLMTRPTSRAVYAMNGDIDRELPNGQVEAGRWRDEGEPLGALDVPARAIACAEAKEVQQELQSYFVSVQGELDWQYNVV